MFNRGEIHYEEHGLREATRATMPCPVCGEMFSVNIPHILFQRIRDTRTIVARAENMLMDAVTKCDHDGDGISIPAPNLMILDDLNGKTDWQKFVEGETGYDETKDFDKKHPRKPFGHYDDMQAGMSTVSPMQAAFPYARYNVVNQQAAQQIAQSYGQPSRVFNPNPPSPPPPPLKIQSMEEDVWEALYRKQASKTRKAKKEQKPLLKALKDWFLGEK